MSDQMPPQPTQEEIMAMIAQMREMPASNLILQALGLLVSGAEAKLGRPDARQLIDVVAAVVEQAGEHLGDAANELAALVVQLKTAQVQAEAKLAEAGEGGEGDTPPQDPGPEKKETDKLWIPGR